MELIVGAGLIIAVFLVFRLSLPRGGQIRSFLRNNEVQAYYVVVLLGMAAIGFAYLFVGLRGLFS